MTTAYWCLFIVLFLPYIWTLVPRFPWPTYNFETNLAPRLWAESLTGWRQRAYWAHLNAFEAIVPFLAAVVIAHQVGVQQSTIDGFAIAYLVLRIAHGFAYLANLGVIRTLLFGSSWVCWIGLFVAAV